MSRKIVLYGIPENNRDHQLIFQPEGAVVAVSSFIQFCQSPGRARLPAPFDSKACRTLFLPLKLAIDFMMIYSGVRAENSLFSFCCYLRLWVPFIRLRAKSSLNSSAAASRKTLAATFVEITLQIDSNYQRQLWN